MSRPTVPPPSDDDHEDVAWALRAASAQWRREDQADAISWVRRAAETAVEVGQPMRARDLFQLANYLEGGPLPDSMRAAPPPSAPPFFAPSHSVPPSVPSPSMPQPGFPSFSPESSAPPFSHPSLSGPPSFSTAFGGHPQAMVPPPPSFSDPSNGGEMPDVEYVDDLDEVDDVDDLIEEEFLDEEDEETVLIEDEVEELDEAPPPSYSAGYRSPGPHSPGPHSPGPHSPGLYSPAYGGGLSDLPSPARSASEPSTRYRSDPPQLVGMPPGQPSQFPSQVPTRASARAFSSRPARPLSSRPGQRGPSSRPSGPLPPLPSLGPAGGLTSRSTPPGQRSSVPGPPSSSPGGSWPSGFGTESEPIVPARSGTSAPPPARRTRSSQRPRGGFDEAFLDSLEDEDAPPVRRRGPRPQVTFQSDEAETFDAELDTRGQGSDAPLGELDFGSPGSARSQPLPSVPDLPSMGVGPAPSKLPLDVSTVAEYAQHSRQGVFEAHDDIEQELGVDLSLGTPRARRLPGGRSASDFSPTPGRVSVRPTALGLGQPPKTSGQQPYLMAPSASAPPVAPIEPPSHPSQAPPPESMSEPDGDFEETDRRSYELTGQVYGDHVDLATPPPAVEDLDDDDDILADAFQRLQSAPPAQRSSAPPSGLAVHSSRAPAPASGVGGTFVDGTDLMDVPGLQDLPEDAATTLASRARIIQLSPGEEVSDFGVALVTQGAVQLMPTIADASCVLARQGEVLFTRGTMAGDISLRVVGAEPGSRVAVFSERDLEIATSSCPWVADELAEVADRYNAFGGAVLGPLGESLDEMFRMMVFAKCSVKNPAAGTLIAEAGKPMDGMYVLGSGTLEVVSPSGSVTARLSPGDFVFPETVLSAGPARATVRVPPSGALVLYANRMSAHELLATCPPFIEILAGG